MPVVINDFEVLVEPPPSRTDSEAAPQPTEALTPVDIDRIPQHFTERRRRVWAD